MNSFEILCKLLKCKNYIKYEERLKELISINKNDDNAYGCLGYIYFKLDRYEEAETYLKIAVEFENIYALNNIDYLM